MPFLNDGRLSSHRRARKIETWESGHGRNDVAIAKTLPSQSNAKPKLGAWQAYPFSRNVGSMNTILGRAILVLLLFAPYGCGSGHGEPGTNAAGAGAGSTITAGTGGRSADITGAAGNGCSAVSESVSTKNGYGTVQGTLEVPPGCAPMPAVLIISGSGPQDRDGNSPDGSLNTDMYRLLAQGLGAAAVATLRFDDPGVGGSINSVPAREDQYTYQLDIDSAAAWIPVLREHPRVGKVWVAGHSQGALTATLLAQKGLVDGIISLEGAGRPAGVILREQLASSLTAEQLTALDVALTKLESGSLAGTLAAPLDVLLRPSVQPYLISWMQYDPSVEIGKVTGATLIVQGTTDVQIPVSDANLLHQGKPDATLTVIENMCHVLKLAVTSDAATQASSQYVDPTLPLHSTLAPAIVDYISNH